MAKTRALAIFGAGALLVVAGCRVDAHRDDDVRIATPFGGVSVKTDDSVAAEGVGLTVYPGAVLDKKTSGHDHGAADVNMSFGSFHLGVKALRYTTPDPPDKVASFYRSDMAHFGIVIQCRGANPVGTPDRTEDGLSCDMEHGANIHIDADRSQEELKAGSKLHQHIVAIENDGTGTRIGLIALDLPSGVGADKEAKD